MFVYNTQVVTQRLSSATHPLHSERCIITVCDRSVWVCLLMWLSRCNRWSQVAARHSHCSTGFTQTDTISLSLSIPHKHLHTHTHTHAHYWWIKDESLRNNFVLLINLCGLEFIASSTHSQCLKGKCLFVRQKKTFGGQPVQTWFNGPKHFHLERCDALSKRMEI